MILAYSSLKFNFARHYEAHKNLPYAVIVTFSSFLPLELSSRRFVPSWVVNCEWCWVEVHLCLLKPKNSWTSVFVVPSDKVMVWQKPVLVVLSVMVCHHFHHQFFSSFRASCFDLSHFSWQTVKFWMWPTKSHSDFTYPSKIFNQINVLRKSIGSRLNPNWSAPSYNFLL